MNIGDLLSKKSTLIFIAAVIGIVVLLYKFNVIGILLPDKTTIEAIDQNNKDIKIYEDTVATNKQDSIAVDSVAITD